MRIVTPGSAMAEQPNVRSHATVAAQGIEGGTGMWRPRIRFAQKHQPRCRQSKDTDRLGCLGLAQCASLGGG